MSLIVEPNIREPDALYEQLIALHEGHDDATAMRISARLILLLINHIGDRAIIEDAITKASLEALEDQ